MLIELTPNFKIPCQHVLLHGYMSAPSSSLYLSTWAFQQAPARL